MAVFSWKQSVTDTFIATIPLLLWPLFFYLDSVRFSVKLLERIILCLGATYLVLYFYQFINSDTILFGKSLWGDEFIENRGIIRISFPGGGIFYLAVFIAITRISSAPNLRWLYLCFMVAGVIVPVMQVTRVDVVGVLMMYAVHFLKGQSFPKKILITLTCLILALYLSTSYTRITPVKGMVEAQKENVKDGEKYIRLVAGSYFLNNFSPSTTNRVFGNGVPYVDFSSYGRFISIINDQQGFYLEDLGIISVYTLYGVLGVIAYLIIWIKSFTLKLPRQFQYPRYYLWFLLITSLTTSNLYSPNYLISTVIAIYIYQTVSSRAEKYKAAIQQIDPVWLSPGIGTSSKLK